MSPSPKDKSSFTLTELMSRLSFFIENINRFIDDLGSGKEEWRQIRKKLKLMGLQIGEFDENVKITDVTLVKQFNELSFDSLRKMDLENFRIKLHEAIEKLGKGEQITYSLQSKSDKKHDSEIDATPTTRGSKPGKKS